MSIVDEKTCSELAKTLASFASNGHTLRSIGFPVGRTCFHIHEY